MASTRAIIHLNHFIGNIKAIQNHVGPDVAVCLAVKADAYGHGAERIAKEAVSAGVDWLAVATCEEALAIKSLNLGVNILLLGLPLPGETDILVDNGIHCVVADYSLIDAFTEASEKKRLPAQLHLAIDTGMGRNGCSLDAACRLAGCIADSNTVELAGVCTHFAAADEDAKYTKKQIERFNCCIDEIRSKGVHPGIIHAANSGGIVSFPDAWYDMVRPGIIAYGNHTPATGAARLETRSVMELVSRIVLLKEVAAGTPISYGMTYKTTKKTVIATVAAGYGDGYSRRLSNVGEVVIRGRRFPVAGRICMDQLMVDLGASAEASIGDEVVLFGPEAPATGICEIATLTGTISYEVTCNISKRVPRAYLP